MSKEKVWFTADEHYAHWNINRFCNRGFKDLHHMHKTLRDNFNSVVKPEDHTYHLGDFTFESDPGQVHSKYVQPLNGGHTFLMGSHDKWLKREWDTHEAIFGLRKAPSYLIEKSIENRFLVMCHYAMRTWPRSHHGSIQLFGHSHGRLEASENQLDVGVDTNNFYPYDLPSILRKLGIK